MLFACHKRTALTYVLYITPKHRIQGRRHTKPLSKASGSKHAMRKQGMQLPSLRGEGDGGETSILRQ